MATLWKTPGEARWAVTQGQSSSKPNQDWNNHKVSPSLVDSKVGDPFNSLGNGHANTCSMDCKNPPSKLVEPSWLPRQIFLITTHIRMSSEQDQILPGASPSAWKLPSPRSCIGIYLASSMNSGCSIHSCLVHLEHRICIWLWCRLRPLPTRSLVLPFVLAKAFHGLTLKASSAEVLMSQNCSCSEHICSPESTAQSAWANLIVKNWHIFLNEASNPRTSQQCKASKRSLLSFKGVWKFMSEPQKCR